ncbi:doublecortin domain-containing protein 1-like isoform X1 [Clavelina lepadiformis]|uniref:doublecortin domain-containing protein 1-like isoform X1 n=1 Tax=Clavelina lepadiformis TaxID=159417 RepID=UPI0040420060
MSLRHSSYSSMEDKIVKEYKETLGKEKKKRDKAHVVSPYLQNVAPRQHQKQKRPISAKPIGKQSFNNLEESSVENTSSKIMGAESEDSDDYSSSFTESSSDSEQADNRIKEKKFDEEKWHDENYKAEDYSRRPRPQSAKHSRQHVASSPYLHNVAPEIRSLFKQKRPMSAKGPRRRQEYIVDSVPAPESTVKEEISGDEDVYSSAFEDSNDEMEKNLEKLVTEKKENSLKETDNKISKKKVTRPSSAQLFQRSDNFPPKTDTSKPVFKRQTQIITCTAYKNGSFDSFTRIAAATVKQLLEDATLKLGLNVAARRVFLSDGSEIFRPQDVPKDADVFVSRGESFRDPFKVAKNLRSLQSPSAWSMQGVSLPPRRKPRTPSSKRINELVGKNTRRIIVYLNGEGSKGHEVVFNEQKPSHRFLDDCTQRLGLNTSAKALFNWKGEEIKHIKQVEKIESKIQAWVMYGPLWVSKWQGFNPNGAKQYVMRVVTSLKSQLLEAQLCKKELEFVEREEFDKVNNKEILNLDEEAIPLTKEKVMEDIKEFRLLLKKYKSRLRLLNKMVAEQENQGMDYLMKNIKEIECDDKLVGEHGLRLRIYDNGNDLNSQNVYLNMRDIQRGAKDPKLIRARFLEALTSWHKPTDPSGPARSTVVRRLFDENGEEIMDVMKIENEQQIWLSYGEDYKPSVTAVLTLQFEKVAAVEICEENVESVKVYREPLDVRDLPDGCEKSSQWEIVEGFPPDKVRQFNDVGIIEKHTAQESMKQKVYSPSDHYLQHKQDPSIIMRPALISERKMAGLWPKDSQAWVINKNGKIYSRAFPQLALTTNHDCPITIYFKDGSVANGYQLILKKKVKWDKDWGFSADGNIYSLVGINQQVLTFLDSNLIKEVKEGAYADEGDPSSVSNLMPAADTMAQQASTVVVLDKVKGQKSQCQRWAIKQESLSPPYQWKHTKVANPQWRKLAYSWPVLTDGNWNNDYRWPMEGTFIPNAPSLIKQRRNSEDVELKLKVLKNGEKNKNSFVCIVAPDLSSMQKERKNNKKQIEELELNMFLEKATSLLGLSFAARRLFDENGKEVPTLRSLKRNQIVYASVGESWIDPKVTKTEYQRRHLLAKLTHDVSMISAYCDLRNPQDFVIEAEKENTVGSRLLIKKCSLRRHERETIRKDEMNQVDEVDKTSTEGSEESFHIAGDASAHEKSHLRSDQRLEAKKYSWQVNEQTPESTSQEKEAKKRKVPQREPKQGVPQQRFKFSEGFISPVSEPNLAFGVTGIDLDNLSGNVEVILCKKSVDDPVQQWELTEDGLIRLKCSNRLVLGVSMPSYKPDQDKELTIDNCLVTVQTLKQTSHGRANQKWLWDPVFNFIEPFHSSITDKEITAANYVSLCTYAVVGSEALSQDGYITDIPAESPVVVCSSCAKVMRGQHQLTRAPEQWNFVCAMANPRKFGLKQYGSFSCLNGKVDLSTYEADTTLNHWVAQLEKLRQETSLRLLHQEIQSTTLIQACRVAAMRNGEGRLRAPEIIVGTSISGILEQCTQRLPLGTAARRLYTSDGMHILHMEQLIEWASNNFYKQQEERSVMLVGGKNVYERGEPEGNPLNLDTQKQEDGNNSREGTPDHIAAEAGIKVTTSDLSKKLRPPSGRRKASIDKCSRGQQQSRTQEVPLSVILREPVEVWVSCGENFIPPATAERMFEANIKAQVNRNEDNLVLDTEKHVLRHLQGRRFKDMSPTRLQATRRPSNPILVEGGWMETTKDEATKMEKVHRLEEHLAESRPLHQHPRTRGINLNRELYRQANRKRVLVYLNGDSSKRALYVWGESMSEILADATVRLGMHRRARFLYAEDGSKVTNFDLIERDSLLCVTSGDPLRGRPKQSNVEMKAKWARIRKQHGAQATEIVINPKSPEPNPAHVNPFGPAVPTPESLTWEELE